MYIRLDVTVTLSEIKEVPAGGRSAVQTVTLKNGPVEPLTFSFFILDNLPTFSDVWPRSVTLKDGELSGKFWVSASKNTTGVNGQLLVTMTGTDKSIFHVANRLVPFTIINPRRDLPYVVAFDLSITSSTTIDIAIQTNKDCTFYYWIGPVFARPVTLE